MHMLQGFANGCLDARAGSNYFHYVVCGSFSEYSAGIDFVPADCDESATTRRRYSSNVWGPNPPDYFTHNAEA